MQEEFGDTKGVIRIRIPNKMSEAVIRTDNRMAKNEQKDKQ
jgi:hypothetical protein